jgi:septum formation protein
MLRLLSGRRHRVYTGVALVGPGFRAARVVETRVRFRRLRPAEITAYLATGEADDKAGAYAAQGRGALFVAAIEGDWTNVVGLPLNAVRELLARAAAR